MGGCRPDVSLPWVRTAVAARSLRLRGRFPNRSVALADPFGQLRELLVDGGGPLLGAEVTSGVSDVWPGEVGSQDGWSG